MEGRRVGDKARLVKAMLQGPLYIRPMNLFLKDDASAVLRKISLQGTVRGTGRGEPDVRR